MSNTVPKKSLISSSFDYFRGTEDVSAPTSVAPKSHSSLETNEVSTPLRISRISSAAEQYLDNSDTSSEPPLNMMEDVADERLGSSLTGARRVSPDEGVLASGHALSLGAMEREYNKDTWRMYELIHKSGKFDDKGMERPVPKRPSSVFSVSSQHSLDSGIFSLDLDD